MMMNVMAMWILLSTLGAAMVMSPDPLGKTPNGERPLDLAKEATRESLHYASEAARQTGESIRRTVTSASQIPGKAAQTVQQVIKGGSQAGLEKIGLAQPVQPPSNLDVLKSRIQASEEKMAALKEAAAESARNIQLDVEETIRDYTGTSKKPPTRYEVAKEKIAGSYDATKDTAGETVEAGREKADHVANAVKEAVVAAGLRVEEGAHETYKSAEDRVSESSDFVDKLAQKIVQSVEDDIGAASTKTSQISKSAYKRAADGLRQTATRAKRTVGFEDRAPPTYQQRIQEATEQAADILKSRGAEAASFLPNVGQGLAYGSLDTEEKKSVGEYVSKAGEWMGVTGTGYPEPGLKTRVGRYVEGVKNKLSGTSTTKGGDWREEFLNKLGIYSEADLSRKDVMVGKFTGFLSGGVFHKVGEALNLSVTATQDAVRSAGQTVTDTVSQTKATVTDGIKSAQDNLTRTSGGNKKDDGEGNSLKQSGANLLKKVSWITTAWVISAFKTAHLFAFASVYGTSLWITFVSGYVLSRSVPRHQFGFVQSRVFPTYLKLTASGQLVCLISYIGLHPWADADRSEKFEYLFLWGVLMTTLANTFILEPQATKLMFEKLKIEKDEGGHNHIGHDVTDEDEETRARLTKVNSTFHVLHGYSSLANLLGLLGMTLHLWHLSGRISI